MRNGHKYTDGKSSPSCWAVSNAIGDTIWLVGSAESRSAAAAVWASSDKEGISACPNQWHNWVSGVVKKGPIWKICRGGTRPNPKEFWGLWADPDLISIHPNQTTGCTNLGIMIRTQQNTSKTSLRFRHSSFHSHLQRTQLTLHSIRVHTLLWWLALVATMTLSDSKTIVWSIEAVNTCPRKKSGRKSLLKCCLNNFHSFKGKSCTQR